MTPRLDAITRTAMVAGLSAVALSTAAHAELIDVKWNAAGKFERTQSIAPGKFMEICESLAKGAAVAWQFEASAALNFNVHFHQGKEVAFPEKQDSVSELKGMLVAQSNEDYCWMWTNKGDVSSSIRLLLAKAAAEQ